jgi:hypothetical protein
MPIALSYRRKQKHLPQLLYWEWNGRRVRCFSRATMLGDQCFGSGLDLPLWIRIQVTVRYGTGGEIQQQLTILVDTRILLQRTFYYQAGLDTPWCMTFPPYPSPPPPPSSQR